VSTFTEKKGGSPNPAEKRKKEISLHRKKMENAGEESGRRGKNLRIRFEKTQKEKNVVLRGKRQSVAE